MKQQCPHCGEAMTTEFHVGICAFKARHAPKPAEPAACDHDYEPDVTLTRMRCEKCGDEAPRKPAADERPALREFWITNLDNRLLRTVFKTREEASKYGWSDETLIHVREVKK